MKKEMKLYNLVNLEGCFMCSVYEISWIKARKCFAQSYEGKYNITCEHEIKVVILK